MPYHYNICGSSIAVSMRGDGNMGVRGRISTWKNKLRFFKSNFGGDSRLVSIWPSHGNAIGVVDRHSGGIIKEVDALITQDPEVVLAVDWADCFPVVVWDIRTRLKAVIHVGIRGAALEIISLVIQKMVSLGSDVKDLYAFIGPGICQDCYEYGTEIKTMLGAGYHHHLEHNKVSERYNIDIAGIIFQQMVQHDFPEKNVTKSYLCTFERDNLFSARRQQPETIEDLESGVLMVK